MQGTWFKYVLLKIEVWIKELLCNGHAKIQPRWAIRKTFIAISQRNEKWSLMGKKQMERISKVFFSNSFTLQWWWKIYCIVEFESFEKAR